MITILLTVTRKNGYSGHLEAVEFVHLLRMRYPVFGHSEPYTLIPSHNRIEIAKQRVNWSYEAGGGFTLMPGQAAKLINILRGLNWAGQVLDNRLGIYWVQNAINGAVLSEVRIAALKEALNIERGNHD